MATSLAAPLRLLSAFPPPLLRVEHLLLMWVEHLLPMRVEHLLPTPGEHLLPILVEHLLPMKGAHAISLLLLFSSLASNQLAHESAEDLSHLLEQRKNFHCRRCSRWSPHTSPWTPWQGIRIGEIGFE